uniref:Uncharacterized protein n=1 Tax=Glossina palpalis gambiensis TaxID=67801 RepID=A0A1B0BR35_9MUSC
MSTKDSKKQNLGPISEKTSLDRDTLKISVIGIYKIWAQLTKIHAGMSRPGRQQMLAHSEL